MNMFHIHARPEQHCTALQYKSSCHGSIPNDPHTPKLAALCRDCWAQQPEERPPFSQIVARLGELLSQAAASLEPPV